MLYLEDFLELIELLPSELRDRFTEMRELDLQVQNAMDKNDESVKMFFKNAAHLAPEERQRQVDKIRKHYYKIIDDADEKVCLANAMQDLVERFLRKLDSELGKFKAELEADNPGITEQLEKKVLEAEEAQNKSKREKRKRTARCADSSNTRTDFDKSNGGSSGPSAQKISSLSSNSTNCESTSSHADIIVDDKPDGPSTSSSNAHLNRLSSPAHARHGLGSHGSQDRNNVGHKIHESHSFSLGKDSPNSSGFPGLPSSTGRNNSFDNHGGPSPSSGGLGGRGMNSSGHGINSLDDINSSIMADLNAATASRRSASASSGNLQPASRVAEYRTLTVGDGQQMTVIHQGMGGAPITQLSPNSGALTSPSSMHQPHSAISGSNSAFLHSFQQSPDVRGGARPRKLNSRVGDMLKEVAMRNEIRDTSAGSMMLGGGNHPAGLMAGPVIRGASNSEDESSDPNEPRYCICNRVSYGEMVACDNKDCPFEWFHYSCVGITQPPKGKWYCPQCTAAMRRRASRLAPDQILGS